MSDAFYDLVKLMFLRLGQVLIEYINWSAGNPHITAIGRVFPKRDDKKDDDKDQSDGGCRQLCTMFFEPHGYLIPNLNTVKHETYTKDQISLHQQTALSRAYSHLHSSKFYTFNIKRTNQMYKEAANISCITRDLGIILCPTVSVYQPDTPEYILSEHR